MQLRMTSFKFIQIGANDGIEADPLRHLIIKYHLQGLLIEPIPDVYQRLKANYASEPQLEFANVAIGSSSAESKINLYRFRAGAAKGHVHLDGLTTFNRARIENHATNIGLSLKEIEAVNVPCLSVKEVINRYGYEKFNFLCIDAEGMDMAILKSAFDSGIEPEIVYMEILDMLPQQRQQLFDLVYLHGYKINADVGDLLAVKLDSIAYL